MPDTFICKTRMSKGGGWMWKVVIIDDDERVLRGLKMIIPWDRLECKWVGQANNGQEGLQLIYDTVRTW